MIKTMEDVKQVREMASRLEKFGVPQKATERIRKWVKGEVKRLRDEAHRDLRGAGQ